MGYGPPTVPYLKTGAPYPCSFCDVTPSRASSHVMLIMQPITSIQSLAPTPVTPLLSDCKHYDRYGPQMGPKIRCGITKKWETDPCYFLRPFFGVLLLHPLFSNFGPRGLALGRAMAVPILITTTPAPTLQPTHWKPSNNWSGRLWNTHLTVRI